MTDTQTLEWIERLASCPTQKDAADVYREILEDHPGQEFIKMVNQAIIKRWSLSGLKRIKNLAWREM